MRYPAGPATTKSLNDGVTGTSPATGDATGYLVYVSQVNAPSTLYRQESSTTGVPFDSNTSISTVVTSLGTAPTTNTSTITPPATAPILNAVGGSGSSLSTGTYYIAYSYVTAHGQTTLSPVLPVAVVAGQVINVGTFVDPHETSLTLEMTVPRLEDWHVTRYAVYVSSYSNVPTCNVYVDSLSVTSLIDTTTMGANNSANADLYMRPGQKFIVQWLGVDLAASCAFTVYGEKTS